MNTPNRISSKRSRLLVFEEKRSVTENIYNAKEERRGSVRALPSHDARPTNEHKGEIGGDNERWKQEGTRFGL